MNIFINDNQFRCKVCVTPQSVQEGMKHKTFNMNFNGMFFIMPSNGKQSFWMYECVDMLDIIFIDNDTITKVHHKCLPCDDEYACEQYGGLGNKVLEVAGGTCQKLDIKKGDKIKMSMY